MVSIPDAEVTSFTLVMSIDLTGIASPSLWHLAATGWRRLIGSPKLQIIFHKRATK